MIMSEMETIPSEYNMNTNTKSLLVANLRRLRFSLHMTDNAAQSRQHRGVATGVGAGGGPTDPSRDLKTSFGSGAGDVKCDKLAHSR